jgi:hypothetical protein
MVFEGRVGGGGGGEVAMRLLPVALSLEVPTATAQREQTKLEPNLTYIWGGNGVEWTH